MAVLIGIIGGLSEKQIVNTFITGAADMMSVVLVIALARGISVLMANTGLDVFVLDAAANALAGLSGVIFAPMSFLVYFRPVLPDPPRPPVWPPSPCPSWDRWLLSSASRLRSWS